jgi:uncharacterized protein
VAHLDPLSALAPALGAAGVALGAVAQRVAGIGFGLVAAPALMLAEGPERGVPLVLALNLVVNVLALPSAWPDVDVRRSLTLALPALAVAPLGAWSVTVLPPGPLQVVTGGLVLCGLAAVVCTRAVSFPTGAAGLTSAGLVSGYMNVVAGVGGPAVAVYAAAVDWPPRRFVASMQFFFGIVNAGSLVALGGPVVAGARSAWLLIALLVGLAAGHVLAPRIDERWVRVAALGIAAVGAAATVLTGVAG